MKRLLTCFLLSILIAPAYAQQMLGIANSNYAGTDGLMLNPSSMVDSRLSFDFSLITLGVSADNNYIYIPKNQLSFFGLKNSGTLAKDTGYTDAKNFDPNNISAMLNKTYKAYVGALLNIPSVTFKIKDNYFGIGFGIRTVLSASDVPAPLAKWAYADSTFKYGPLLNKPFSFNNLKIAGMVWGEINFSYGRVLYNQGSNYFNSAITIKRLLGLYSGYANISGTNVSSTHNNTLCDTCYSITADNSTIDYGTSYQSADTSKRGLNVKGTGWGFDIGFTYEYRPDAEQHHYQMDGQTLIDPEQNQYKLKIGLSILDIGKIKFTDGGVYNLEGTTDIANFPAIQTQGFDGFNRKLSALYYNGDTAKSLVGHNLDVALPHALSLQVDYHAWNKFYANMTWMQAIAPSANGPLASSLLSITPRYERPNFEVAVPLRLYQYDQINLGLAFRFWNILVIGSDKIGSLMGLSDLEGMDFYAGLKIAIKKKRIKDSDGDGVSDKMDKCPHNKGPWETLGCPDRDGDGVPDYLDSCPDVKGLPQFHGCPDTDGDGIPDYLDSCPTVAGLPQFHGCPDTDGDGIPDYQDSCPTVAGLPQFHGCPDTDGDGIPDQLDSCPLVPGPASNHGCPIIEKVVVKPAEPVKVELNKEEQEVINKVFSNLEFETGKWIIRPSSFASLDQLAELLKKKPNFKLLIDGHTDNVGSAASNMQLSKNRAESVKTYLSNKGIDPSRITAKGYGLTKPVASNKTPEGRQKNRRVEFTIVE